MLQKQWITRFFDRSGNEKSPVCIRNRNKTIEKGQSLLVQATCAAPDGDQLAQINDALCVGLLFSNGNVNFRCMCRVMSIDPSG